MEGAAKEGCVAFNGEECDGFECWDEVRYAADAKAVFHGVCYSPSCCRDVLFIVAECDDWWGGTGVFKEMKFTEEVATACKVMRCAAIRDG